MNRAKLLGCLTALGMVSLLTGSVQAQYNTYYTPTQQRYVRPNYGPGYRPGLSPYLNLIRGGDPAANYYLGTIPEQQRRQQAQQFGSEITELQDKTSRLPEVSPLDKDLTKEIPSGHPTGANTTLGYYGDTRGFYAKPKISGMASRPSPFSPKSPVPSVR